MRSVIGLLLGVLAVLLVFYAVLLMTSPDDPEEVSSNEPEAAAARSSDTRRDTRSTPDDPERVADDGVSTAASEDSANPEIDAAEPDPGPWITVRVLAEDTRQELSELECWAIPEHFMSASLRRPFEGSGFERLGVDLSSPLEVRVFGSDRPGGFRGFSLRTEGGRKRLNLGGNRRRGVVLYARSPGHAWGRIQLEVTAGGERLLLLPRAASLSVQVRNVQEEAYAGLEHPASLRVTRTDVDNYGLQNVRFEKLAATLEENGLQLDDLEPGEYELSAEIGDRWTWRENHVLASETVTIQPGDRREVVLTLSDPPAISKAPLSGTLSIPIYAVTENVKLCLYESRTYSQGKAAVEIPLSEMHLVQNGRWSWQAGEVNTGRYQAKAWPFLVSFGLDVPEGGNTEAALQVPELVDVEMVMRDASTGETVPVEKLFWNRRPEFEGQVNHIGATVECLEVPGPGHFRWYAPAGPAFIGPSRMAENSNYNQASVVYEITGAQQRLVHELAAICGIAFTFLDGEAALPLDDPTFGKVWEDIRPVTGDGAVRIIALRTTGHVELSGPGLYEISFESVQSDLYLPITPRQVDVPAGEIVKVVVQLQRR